MAGVVHSLAARSTSLGRGNGSRVTGDCHARFYERRGVKLPPATHHRVKTLFKGWSFRMEPDGTLHVTTPSGITRTTQPWAMRRRPPAPPPTDGPPPPDDPPPF